MSGRWVIYMGEYLLYGCVTRDNDGNGRVEGSVTSVKERMVLVDIDSRYGW